MKRRNTKPKSFRTLYIYLMLVEAAVTFGFLNKQHPILQANAQIVSPLPTKAVGVKNELPTRVMVLETTPTVTLTPTPTLTPSERVVDEEIRRVFGKHYQKAMLLLKGDGHKGECERGENHNLDPKAINDNRTWGGKGRDWGVFQINDYWQGVTNPAFLTDYTINIRLAWNIYERDGYSFKLWTCGKHYGI